MIRRILDRFGLLRPRLRSSPPEALRLDQPPPDEARRLCAKLPREAMAQAQSSPVPLETHVRALNAAYLRRYYGQENALAPCPICDPEAFRRAVIHEGTEP